jgi:hypothetical protein
MDVFFLVCALWLRFVLMYGCYWMTSAYPFVWSESRLVSIHLLALQDALLSETELCKMEKKYWYQLFKFIHINRRTLVNLNFVWRTNYVSNLPYATSNVW